MKKTVLVIVLIALTVQLLAGCAPAAAPAKSLQKLTVNEVTHSVFYAPFYAAVELGYFEQEGLELELVNGGGADKSMTALLSGDAHIGLMGPEAAIYVYNEGKEDHPVVIGQLTACDGSMLVGREKDDNFTWDKLKGKSVIGGRKGGIPNMALEYAIKQNGLLIPEDVVVDTSVSFNLMAGAFEGSDGDFDYVTLFEPTASLCEQEEKGFIVASVGEECGDLPFTAFMVKKSMLAENKQLYTGFMRAVAKGQRWIAENTPEKIAQTIAPQFADSDIALLTKVAKNYKRINAWKTEPYMLEEDFERLQTVMETAGELEKRAVFAEVVNNSIAESIK